MAELRNQAKSIIIICSALVSCLVCYCYYYTVTYKLVIFFPLVIYCMTYIFYSSLEFNSRRLFKYKINLN